MKTLIEVRPTVFNLSWLATSSSILLIGGMVSSTNQIVDYTPDPPVEKRYVNPLSVRFPQKWSGLQMADFPNLCPCTFPMVYLK